MAIVIKEVVITIWRPSLKKKSMDLGSLKLFNLENYDSLMISVHPS